MSKYYCRIGTDDLIEEIIPRTQPEGALFAGMDITELYSPDFISALTPTDADVNLGQTLTRG